MSRGDNGRNQNGMANEMRAAACLIDEGYEVFIGVGNTSCDLMALKDGAALRVEVKTAGPERRDGTRWVSGDPEKFDMLIAVVTETWEVMVNPHLDGRVGLYIRPQVRPSL